MGTAMFSLYKFVTIFFILHISKIKLTIFIYANAINFWRIAHFAG